MLDEILLKLAKQSSDVATDRDVIPYDDNIKLKKVAFDLFKIDNDPYEHLWRLDESDDGKVLVRASDPQYHENKNGDWAAISDYDQRNVTLSYKNVPLVRFPADKYGYSSDEITTFKGALLERVMEDDGFLKEVLAEQPTSMREAVTQTFPELKKFI